MIEGYQVDQIIKGFTDKFDFMLRYKTPAGAKVYIGDREMLKTVRYYVSKTGEPMKKIAKPKGEIGGFKRAPKVTDETWTKVNAEIEPGSWDSRIHTKSKSKYEMTETSIESGWLVKQCNHVKDFDWNDVNYDYYINEVKKLLIGDQG